MRDMWYNKSIKRKRVQDHMKDNLNFCLNECPYCHDVLTCIGGAKCPLKVKKRKRIKNIGFGIGYFVGGMLFKTPLILLLIYYFS